MKKYFKVAIMFVIWYLGFLVNFLLIRVSDVFANPALVTLILGLSIVAVYWYGEKQQILQPFTLEKITWQDLLWVVAAVIIGRIIVYIYVLYFGIPSNDEILVLVEEFMGPISFGILGTIAAPIVEELVFRAGIMNCIYGMSQKGLVISSVIFGLIHVHGGDNFIPTLLVYSALGYAMGYIYKKTGKLECAILVHILNNFIGIVFE